MKKAFCFSLIVMFIALAGIIPVRADNVSVGGYYDDTDTLTSSQISTLENTALLLDYLRQGGTIDVKNTDSSYDSSSLIEDFGNFVRDVIEVGGDIINPFQTEVQYHGIQPIRYATPYVYQLMGILPFYSLQESEEPTPEPDLDYNSFLNCINGSVNYNNRHAYIPLIRDYTYRNNSDSRFFHGTILNKTIYSYPLSGANGFVNVDGNQYKTGVAVGSSVITIYINGNDTNGWTIEHTSASLDNSIFEYVYNSPRFNSLAIINYDTGWFDTPNGVSYNAPTWLSNQFSATYNSLSDVFNFLVTSVRNVNIYVNNEPWAIVSTPDVSYNIEISTGTVTPENNGKVRWEYDTYIYYDIDLIEQELSLLLDEIRNLNHPTIIRFDDLKDVIVDVDGQAALAVKVLDDPRNIDKIYMDTYGPIIPAFLPMFTPVIDDVDIITIADTAVSPIPSDLLEVFGYMFMGVLFVGFIHRLLE